MIKVVPGDLACFLDILQGRHHWDVQIQHGTSYKEHPTGLDCLSQKRRDANKPWLSLFEANQPK